MENKDLKTAANRIEHGFFSEITQPDSQVEPTSEKYEDLDFTGATWFPKFQGSNNLYPQLIAWAIRSSPTLAAVIGSKVDYTKGTGFVFNDTNGDEIELDSLQENAQRFINDPTGDGMTSLFDLFGEMCKSWIAHGELTMRAKRAKVGDAVARTLTVVDPTQPRLVRKADLTSDTVVITPYWDKIKNDHKSTYLKKGKAEYLPIWNLRDAEPPEYVVRKFRKSDNYDRYGLPDWVAAMKKSITEYLVDTYNHNRLDTGFFPEAFITYVGGIPSGYKNAKEYLESQRTSMKGAHKSGRVRLAHVTSRDAVPEIHEFAGARDGEFQDLINNARDGIITANRWYPSLSGVATPGSLGSNQQLRSEYKLAMAMVIPSYREPVLAMLNRLLETYEMPFRLGVKNREAINFDETLDTTDSWTINEQRAVTGQPPLPDEYIIDGKYVGDMLTNEMNSKLGAFVTTQRIIDERTRDLNADNLEAQQQQND